MKQFLVIGALSCLVACKPTYKETKGRLFHSDISTKSIDPKSKASLLSDLDTWATQNGFIRISGSDLAVSIRNEREPNYYSPIYSRPLDPKIPKSRFYLTVRDIPNFFGVTLFTIVSGDHSERLSQIPLMRDLRDEFKSSFGSRKPFDWDTFTKEAEQGAAANP